MFVTNTVCHTPAPRWLARFTASAATPNSVAAASGRTISAVEGFIRESLAEKRFHGSARKRKPRVRPQCGLTRGLVGYSSLSVISQYASLRNFDQLLIRAPWSA